MSVARCICVVLTVSFGVLGSGQLARAATVGKAGDPAAITYSAAAGEANRLFVSAGASSYVFLDMGAPIVALAGCSSVSANEARCPRDTYSATTMFAIDLGDLSDGGVVALDGEFVSLAGGQGDDELELANNCGGVDPCFELSEVHGGEGDDTLVNRGEVYLYGEAGDDSLTPESGGILIGGEGADTFNLAETTFAYVSYEDRLNPVFVDPDGVADDGEPGEQDNVLPAMDPGAYLIGGKGADRLEAGDTFVGLLGLGGNDLFVHGGTQGLNLFVSGGNGDDVYLGGPGHNDVYGGKGHDVLAGGPSSDGLYGGSGNDTVRGGQAHDWVVGGWGDDSLTGGKGEDLVEGNFGHDVFHERDGFTDKVRGGPGNDRGYFDARLDLVATVEKRL